MFLSQAILVISGSITNCQNLMATTVNIYYLPVPMGQKFDSGLTVSFSFESVMRLQSRILARVAFI